MSVVITGAGGVVGQALASFVRTTGQDVVTAASRSDVDFESFSDTLAFFKSAAPTHVYHLAAAVFGVGGNLAFPGDAYRRNTLINTHVVEAARQCGVKKIVAMGSVAMYSDGETQPFVESSVMNGRPHFSEEAYAFTKRGLLVSLESYRKQFGLDFAFAVATNMYGPGDRFDSQHGHVIPSLVRKFWEAEQSGDPVEIWGDGTPTRDFLYADDAAVALSMLMEGGDNVYNVASGLAHTIRDVVEILSNLFPSVQFSWDTSKPMGQLTRCYDVQKLASLGFTPCTRLAEGLERTVAWFRLNHEQAR